MLEEGFTEFHQHSVWYFSWMYLKPKRRGYVFPLNVPEMARTHQFSLTYSDFEDCEIYLREDEIDPDNEQGMVRTFSLRLDPEGFLKRYITLPSAAASKIRVELEFHTVTYFFNHKLWRLPSKIKYDLSVLEAIRPYYQGLEEFEGRISTRYFGSLDPMEVESMTEAFQQVGRAWLPSGTPSGIEEEMMPPHMTANYELDRRSSQVLKPAVLWRTSTRRAGTCPLQ
jgi:hypothetical protein